MGNDVAPYGFGESEERRNETPISTHDWNNPT